MAKKERKNMNRVVEFLQPYSTKQQGEKLKCNIQLASALVSRGFAKYVVEVNEIEVVEKNEVESKPKKTKKKNEKI